MSRKQVDSARVGIRGMQEAFRGGIGSLDSVREI